MRNVNYDTEVRMVKTQIIHTLCPIEFTRQDEMTGNTLSRQILKFAVHDGMEAVISEMTAKILDGVTAGSTLRISNFN